MCGSIKINRTKNKLVGIEQVKAYKDEKASVGAVCLFERAIAGDSTAT